jgi:hypothetical protein
VAEARLYAVSSPAEARSIVAGLRAAGYAATPDLRSVRPMVSVMVGPDDWFNVEAIIRGHDPSATRMETD